MRSARLLSLIIDLSRLRSTTVAVLADRHGVSPRTVQRDLVALQGMGVPLWTRTGPAGGVGLVEGWTSPIAGMPAQQTTALLLGETAAGDLGLAADFRAARLRLREADRDRDGDLNRRILIDSAAWFTESEEPTALPAVSRAVWTGRRLRIRYRRGGTTATRVLDPLGLVLKTDRWYLVAAHRRAVRTYRVARIEHATVLDLEAWRPADFSLASAWHRSRAEFEEGLTRITVRLTLPRSALPALRRAAPGPRTTAVLDAVTATPSGGEDRVTVDLPMESPEIAASQLLQVPGVAVSSPAAVRERLAERGRDLWERNRQGAAAPTSGARHRTGSP